jgi:Fe-S cluster assembly protein SufD
MNAPVTLLKTTAETELTALFAASQQFSESALRKTAFQRFEDAGLPHRRIEAWHYTNLRSLMRNAAPLAAEPTAEVANKRPWSLVEHDDVFSFVDGWLVKSPKLPKGVTAHSLAEVMTTAPDRLSGHLNKAADLSDDVVTSLNTAFMTGGLLIEVAASAVIKEPLSFAFETTGETASFARIIVSVGDGASLTLIETHRGLAGAAAQENTVIEISVGEKATVEHVRINTADVKAQTLSTLAVSVAEKAEFNSLSFTTGAALSRHQVFARVHGDDAKLGIRGVTLIRGEQISDSTLVVEHAALNGESRELFKTVVDEEARGVFQGKIIVKPHAQKTDGQMASNALLIGEHSAMNCKPELEIFADDVQCAHGATVGDLDTELLFYLRSRGIQRKDAEALMIQAFAGAALEHVSHEGLRDVLTSMTEEWLQARA